MTMLASPLLQNLSAHVRLTAEEAEAIEAAASKNIRSIGAHKDIIREGARPDTVKVVLEGWAVRYKQLPDGRRQILALMIAGDMCDANVCILERMDHSLGTLTPVRYAEIGQEDFEHLMASSANIAKAMWRSELVAVSIQREWTLNVGQRIAPQRIAHLFCEMFTRLQRMGLAQGDSCDFPLTQAEIGEAAGLTPVHVNRMLQTMRKDGLIELRGKRLHLLDFDGLRDLAMFDPAYLHA